MNFKKIMLVTLFMLAILTIGAVSASDDTDFNETLTADNVEETLDVSLEDNIVSEMSKEDVNIEVNNIGAVDTTSPFANVYLTEKDGNFVIYNRSEEIYREDISTSDRVDEGENYHLGVSLGDVNAYIMENFDQGLIFYDVVSQGDVLRFVLEYQDCDFVTRQYSVDFDDDNLYFNEVYNNYDNFNWWISNHASVNNREEHIVNVHVENIDEGTISVTVTKSNGDSQTYDRNVQDRNEDNDVIWTLEDLDILDELGLYTFRLSYNDEQILADDFTFNLLKLNLNYFEGDIYKEYPFSVLRVYDDEANVEVNVNDSPNPFENGWQNPKAWSLNDLGIGDVGEYNITVISYEDDEIAENFTFKLNVYDECDEFRLFAAFDSVEEYDMENPVLYLLSPQGSEGTFTLMVNDNPIEFTLDSNWMGWTLDDLGIDHDDGYNIQLFNNEDESFICDAWLNVWCIDRNKIGSYIWNTDETGPLYIDCEDSVVNVNVPEGKGGTIIVNVDDNEFKWEIDDDYHDWFLQDLDITEIGEYNIVVKYVDEENFEEIIDEGTLNVLEFNNDTFRATINYDAKKIEFFCPQDSEGTITITIERYDEDWDDFVFFDEFYYDINEDYYGEWTTIPFSELNVPKGTNSRIRFEVSDNQYSYLKYGYLRHLVEVYTKNAIDDRIIYNDNKGYIIEISPSEEFEYGRAEIIVNGVCLFNTQLYLPADYYSYSWNLKTLGMTEPGEYDVTVIIRTEDAVTAYDYNFNVVEFENDTFRVKQLYFDEGDDQIVFFCPQGASGTITMNLEKWEGDDGMSVPAGEYTYVINSTMYNRWTVLPVLDDYNSVHEFRIDGEEIFVEDEHALNSDNFAFEVNDWGNLYDDNTVVRIEVPFTETDSNATFNIYSNENELFSIRLCDLQGRDYEWRVNYDSLGSYAYVISFEEVDYFSSLSDKDPVFFNLSVGRSIGADMLPYELYHIQKAENLVRLYVYEAIRVDMVDFEVPEFDEDEGPILYNISQDDVFLTIGVPDELNITQTAVVEIAYAGNIYTKDLKDFDSTYQYNYLGNLYEIPLSALHPENIKDREIINVTLRNGDEVVGYKTFFAYFNDDGLMVLDNFDDSINLEFHFGEVGHSEFGMSNSDGNLMILTIPYYLNVTEGAIQLIADDGTVLYSKSLSEFDETCINDGEQFREYVILDALDKFDYSCIPEGVNFKASFTYGNTTLSFDKGIRVGDFLHKINTPANVAQLFKVTVSEGILCDGEANAIIIEATDDANRQSIYIDIGGGYFAVYVNGKKVEDLGRLVRVDNETELDLFRLCSSHDGTPKLYIYLSDLNVTENGVYSIRVTHVAEGEEIHVPVETELFNKTFTLTSNVKVNYQNNTAELFTGYGCNPVLMYLDTYYDDISQTNGTITVVNSKGEEILSKNIRDLTYEKNRYVLRYSDFENNDFGDSVTVRYGNGNERDGETTLDVLWKDVESDDFTPTVNDNVDDYYGDFVNMNIPEALNAGQIIVTIKFRNNHGSNISNMNVTTDFGSQAVYKFNVADIKANYENNDFTLALSDLGFYEVNGDYDVDVQFTANGVDVLDIANSTLKVEFSNDILISINETSRYANVLPFAAVKVFEPISAYAELYIDDALYAHKTFEKGFIGFESSALWAAGNHKAYLFVCDNEFGTILNYSATTFETLIQTDDVEVSLNENVKEKEEVFVTITVPKDSVAYIQIDNGEKVAYTLKAGDNTVNLGVLSYGNHTIGIAYNTTLDDGISSFYTNYLSVFVGDDGHWLDLPEPLVLENDDTIKMDFGSDAEGSVVVTIDDVVVANQTLVNGTCDVQLTDLIGGENKYGEHTYNITYSGDKTHDSLSKAGTFNVTYLFKDNLIKEGFPLREYYIIVITLPADAKGNVTIGVEGKQYSSPVSEGEATFKVPNLEMGEHDVNVTYSGDDKYPQSSYTNVLNVSYYAVVGEFEDGKRAVSLILPVNATGNLIVYNENRGETLFSKALVNGKAFIDLNKLTVGKYDIVAFYDWDDYDAKEFKTQFDVLPKIYIKQNITIGETGQIFVDLDNSTGHLLILVDGLSPVLLEIEDGKVNYTFDSEGLSKGNHSVSFQYFGNSFDGNVFYAFNNQTGYFMPINYNMHLLPKSPQVNMTPGDDWIIVDCGNATGTIEVFVDGVSHGVFDIVNGIARIDLSGLKDGNYNLTFKYSGDSIYDGFSKNMQVNVLHKVPTISAKDTKVLYTAKGKFTVTLYDEEGVVVSGEKVSFVIGGKVYGTATTNSNGVAYIVIKKNPDTYKITAKALDVNVTKTLTVKHLLTLKKVTVKRSAKKLVLTATLAKVNKKYLKNKKITFKFNGKKYTAKTNKKGVAKVTINANVLSKLKVNKKITYQATYLKDTVKKSVKVKK